MLSRLRRVLSPIKKNGWVVPRYLLRKHVLSRICPEREIRVALYGGLANRLVALAQAILDSQKWQIPLKMRWQVNSDCGCRFEDLFTNVIAETVEHCRRTDFLDDPRAVCPACPNGVPPAWVKHFERARCWSVPFFGAGLDARAEEFHHVLQMLRPTVEVTRGMYDLLGQPVIGVHIRRTDLPLQHLSPEEWYIQQIDQRLALRRETKVFLCSDNSEVKARWSKRYGGALWTYDINLDSQTGVGHRQSIDGVRNGLRDLLTLAQTQVICGTYNSSFSWLAGVWGKRPVIFPGTGGEL